MIVLFFFVFEELNSQLGGFEGLSENVVTNVVLRRVESGEFERRQQKRARLPVFVWGGASMFPEIKPR